MFINLPIRKCWYDKHFTTVCFLVFARDQSFLWVKNYYNIYMAFSPLPASELLEMEQPWRGCSWKIWGENKGLHTLNWPEVWD